MDQLFTSYLYISLATAVLEGATKTTAWVYANFLNTQYTQGFYVVYLSTSR